MRYMPELKRTIREMLMDSVIGTTRKAHTVQQPSPINRMGEVSAAQRNDSFVQAADLRCFSNSRSIS